MFTSFDKLHLAFIVTTDACAITINLCLIAAITFRTPKSLRPYSVFLLNNAIIDLASAVSSLLGTVRLVQDHPRDSMIIVFLGPCTLISENLCRLSQSLHIMLVQQSTILLLMSFAYRLYILTNMFLSRPAPSRTLIWFLCSLTYLLIALPTTAYFLAEKDISPEVSQQFDLEGYTTAYFYLFDTPALIVNTGAVFLSPIVIMVIFVVRRMLINRIEQVTTNDKKHHEFFARALTFQLLLPFGVSFAAMLWILDIFGMWTNEISERLIMVLFNIISLASPLINFTMLPPYRALLPFAKTLTPSVITVAPRDFTTMAA